MSLYDRYVLPRIIDAAMQIGPLQAQRAALVPRATGEVLEVGIGSGQILFIKHGRAPDARVVAWQDRLNPIWKSLGGGCNLNRRIDDLILQAGLRIARLETGYMRGPKPFTYLYRGLACRTDGPLAVTEASALAPSI